jgi:S-adenosylmethionine synthetase
MARWVAKHIVASGAAERCEIQAAYAIGHPEPTSLHLDTFGTGTLSDAQILAAVKKVFLFNPAEIIRQLDLRRPLYRASTHYGHFGKKGLPWETPSKLAAFVKALHD